MFKEQGGGTKARALLDFNTYKIRKCRKKSVSPRRALVAVQDETNISLGASFQSESEKPSTSACQNGHTRGESSKLQTPELSDEEEERLRNHTAENQEVGLDIKSLKSVSNNSANKKKEITLAERIMVIDYAEKFSERQTALAFGISKSAVNAIKKNKIELMSLYEASKATGNPRCRRVRRTCSKDVNDKTWKWFFQRYRRKDFPTNKELQEKALEYARASGVTNFSASKGWLDTFKKQYGITLCRSVASMKNISSIHAYLKVKESVDAAATGTTSATISPLSKLRHMKRVLERPPQKLCEKL
ncbi:uncharacterized protein [Hetaerina americana]|uniref:uncharacterized protein n=1 Tax=Hetaerina americana TaxID=62018 RepID=UPI003A7F438D